MKILQKVSQGFLNTQKNFHTKIISFRFQKVRKIIKKYIYFQKIPKFFSHQSKPRFASHALISTHNGGHGMHVTV